MKLKSIRIFGFKSFADKVEIELKSNITAIVGPNGSGKSNIVDAVKWVLGEQSLKSLRGTTDMSDVIFKGSETRDPFKRAEVALTFDNQDHFLNTDLLDVEVKRILYASRENEYYINNEKVRLKDITNLFLDSGIGTDAFNIISQGNIESIIHSKPIDRRVILESAAGVLKYKNRKEETIRKLDKTEDNIEKITLITDELQTTVGPLEEQSKVAKKFLELKKELEDLEISLVTYDITSIHENYHQLSKEMEELQKEKDALEWKMGEKDASYERLSLKLLELEKKIEEEQEHFVKIKEEYSKSLSEKTILLERQKFAVDEKKLNEELISLKEQELAFQKEYDLTLNELQELEKKRDAEKKDLADEEEKLSILNIKMKHLEREHNEAVENNVMLKTKKNLLITNIESDMSLPIPVKNVLNHPRLQGIKGTIGKMLEVQEQYVTAIDVALGASSNFIVTENETCASLAIEYLKENHLGRATFFPMNVIKSRKLHEEEIKPLQSFPGFLGIASDLVAYDKQYQNIIENQLGNVLVVKDLKSLNELGKNIHYRYRIVSLEGEILHAGGSLTGGSLKKQTSSLKEKQELERIRQELENNEYTLKSYQKKKEELLNEKEALEETIRKLEKETIVLDETVLQKQSSHDFIKEKLEDKKKSIENAHDLQKGSLEETLIKEMEQIETLEMESELSEKRLENYRTEKSEISSEIALHDKAYRERNSEYQKKEAELKKREIAIGKLDTKMDYLLNVLNDEYHITYEKAKMDYLLDMEPDLARIKVSQLKQEILNLGEVNIGSISEYQRLNERFQFLMKQKADLLQSCEELYQIIDEMDTVMKDRLTETFTKIEKEFQIVFKKMFKGGTGLLKLTDPDHILESGIEIVAEPPGKKLDNIQLLSGGEKTLTAISLLFAILNVYPVPFCILDEVEAALDEANVDMFGKYLEDQQAKSEFLIVTHKKRTMEYATTLYGITMQEQGVSKLVSVSLEDKKQKA